ncbi:TetR/AcrR family transcriptional regulator [Flaviflexus huanghaiensis]|uniref:TetR/AcrR family transcriptional regulator n=1 Tax=Flaviflexus huanghaiensis TaxID=1111473 RepID=UPI0019D5A47D|nr:TetR/AcrR family transcriptional regulator [Flaviflexus huanghaiensis]
MKPGLREAKREATRRALASTAYELVLARGFDQVTVDDITSAIPVSRRTFSNYFANKEEAVAARPVDLVREQLASWVPPEDGDTLTAVTSVVRHLLAGGMPDMLGTIFRLSREHASFGPYGRDVLWTVWDSVSNRLREELAVNDPESQRLAMIMGAAYGLVSSRLQDPAPGAVPAAIVRESLDEALTWMRTLLKPDGR